MTIYLHRAPPRVAHPGPICSWLARHAMDVSGMINTQYFEYPIYTCNSMPHEHEACSTACVFFPIFGGCRSFDAVRCLLSGTGNNSRVSTMRNPIQTRVSAHLDVFIIPADECTLGDPHGTFGPTSGHAVKCDQPLTPMPLRMIPIQDSIQ